MRADTYVSLFVCLSVNLYVCMRVCVCVYVCVPACVRAHACMHVCMYVCGVCVCAQADLRLCWSHIPHCWKSHVVAHIDTGYLVNSTPPTILAGYLLNFADGFVKVFQCA